MILQVIIADINVLMFKLIMMKQTQPFQVEFKLRASQEEILKWLQKNQNPDTNVCQADGLKSWEVGRKKRFTKLLVVKIA